MRTEALSTMPPEMIKENPLEGDILPNNITIGKQETYLLKNCLMSVSHCHLTPLVDFFL